MFCPAPRCFKKKMMQRADQKPVNCMTDIVSNFFKAGELFMDTYAGMLATAKACSQLPQRHRFFGREKELMCSVESFPLLRKFLLDRFGIRS